MSDDFNDDEDLGALDESSFDNFENNDKKSLGDYWRSSAMFKAGIIAAAVIVIVGIMFLFGGGEEDAVIISSVDSGVDVSSAPGTDAVSPVYREAIEEVNQERILEAERTGNSAMPTPLDPPNSQLAIPEQETQDEENDPLQRWRELQEERIARELRNGGNTGGQNNAGGGGPGGALEDSAARTEAVNQLAELLSAQMQSILERASQPIPIESENITSRDNWDAYIDRLEERAAEARGTGQGDGDAFFEDENLATLSSVVVPAGEMYYAQLINEANSDIPSPIVALVLSGPLSGSKIIGSFAVENEYLTLNFNTAVVNGVSIDINAMAFDPATTLPGIATEVDRRLFTRVFLPAAAAFVEGISEAIAESGRTNVTVQGETVIEETEEVDTDEAVASGIEEVGQELGQIIDEIADDTEVLVRIEAGTPIGILFLQPVEEDYGAGLTTVSSAASEL